MEGFTKHEWTCDFGTHKEFSPLVGVLVENRNHPFLEATLKNFSCMLPYASLWVIHSRKNQETVRRLVGEFPYVRTECTLPDEGFTVKECDEMKLKPEFWKKFTRFNRVLIFNVDTGIKKNAILRFMHFDYIGAAWYHDPLSNGAYNGNGGFSLRNPRVMLDILEKHPCTHRIPEDIWFAQHMPPTANLPTLHECELFSTETRDTGGTFGFHDVETYFKDAQKAYMPIEGPVQTPYVVHDATIDGLVNVTSLVRLGIGPSGLHIFRDTRFNPGKVLHIDGTEYHLEHGHLKNDIILRPKSEFHVYYRFSDHNNGNVDKDRPDGFCKRKNLENFLDVFSNSDVHVIADRVSEETATWLRERVQDVEVTNIGNGGDSFCWCISRALKERQPSDIVYFVEDDYFHRRGSKRIIEEGLDIADYVTLYDHPDKYMSVGPNPFVHEGETCLVRRTESVHWKFTNSTTLTCATRVSTLNWDRDTHVKWCCDAKSLDFNLFIDLGMKGRTLVSPMPGYSTHLQPPWIDESCFSERHT